MNFPNFNPPPPGPVNVRTFQALRSFLIEYVVNGWMQYVNNYFGNQFLPLLNTSTFSYGPDIASAATISPTALVQRITGTTAIATINSIPTPSGNFSGPFCAIAQDGFSTTTTGNILLAVSVPAGHSAIFIFHPAWFPPPPASPSGGRWGVVTS